MRTFLIDLENVKNQGFTGIDKLTAEDRVFVFYSDGANSLNIPTIQMINKSVAQIEYVPLQRSGHNAMDFQIVGLLGFLLGSEKNGYYCIVSQDHGYLAPVEFFMDHADGTLNVHVLMAANIVSAIRKWGELEVKPTEPAAEPAAEPAVTETTETPAAKKPRRGRTKKTTPAETVCAAEAPAVEEAAPEEPETEKKPARKRSNRKPKKPAAKVQTLPEKVHTLVGAKLPEELKQFENSISEALKTTTGKNDFYQFFRRTLGRVNGGNLYHAIRDDYEKLVKLDEESK